MSRRRRPSSYKGEKLQLQDDDEIEVDEECVEIFSPTIANCGEERANTSCKTLQRVSRLSQLLSWPSELVTSTWGWLSLEFGRLLDDRIPIADDPGKLLPSLASFVLGLLIVKSYGESLDSMIASSMRRLRDLFDLLADLSCDEIEGLATACVVVLFWIGGLRVLANVIGKLVEAPKTYAWK